MFALLGMVIEGDWYWGAVAGKAAFFAWTPLTALGLYAAGRHWSARRGTSGGPRIPLHPVDRPHLDHRAGRMGITCFLFATLFAAMMALEKIQAGLSPSRWSLLTGLLAGSAMGCKYTGLMQVVIPAAIGLAAALWFAGQRTRREPRFN